MRRSYRTALFLSIVVTACATSDDADDLVDDGKSDAVTGSPLVGQHYSADPPEGDAANCEAGWMSELEFRTATKFTAVTMLCREDVGNASREVRSKGMEGSYRVVRRHGQPSLLELTVGAHYGSKRVYEITFPSGDPDDGQIKIGLIKIGGESRTLPETGKLQMIAE